MRYLSLILLLAAVAAGPRALAQSNAALSLPALVDHLLATYQSHHLFRGVIVVAHHGHIDFVREAGGSVNGRYRIASITKTFTAAAIELLVKRGALSYSDPVSAFIPGFPNGAHITIDNLLEHEGGLADPRYPAFAHKPSTLDDIVADIGAQPPLFAPGTRSQYSNAGYVLLAKIVEAASGVRYNDFLKREFFQPLGLNDTMADDPHAAIERRMSGFVPGPPPSYDTRVPLEEITAYTGSGNLLSSATDLVAWASAVAASRFVDFKTLRYPYGWGKRAYHNHSVIEQSGEENGFISYLVHDITADVTVVVLSNLEVGPNDRIGQAVYAFATLDVPEFPAIYHGAPVAPSLGAYSGSYGTFDVSRNAGTYYVQWHGSTAAQYMQPAGPHSYFVPVDGSTIDVVDGHAVTRRWGADPPVTFRKCEAPPRTTDGAADNC